SSSSSASSSSSSTSSASSSSSSSSSLRSIFEKLVVLQNADGSWKLNEDLSSALAIKFTDMKSRLPKSSQSSFSLSDSERDSLWVTMIAISFIEIKLREFKDEWELLISKAKSKVDAWWQLIEERSTQEEGKALSHEWE